MKVVLSRKGFDSSSGGYPSPILPDGTLLSLPIPETLLFSEPKTKDDKLRWKTWDKKEFQPLVYSDLSLPSSVKEYFEVKGLPLVTYQDVLNELLPKGKPKVKDDDCTKILRWTCHFDPDLIPSVLKRPLEWQSLFGQGSGSESHLKKHNIGANDVFLFFGWYRKTIIQNGKLMFDPKNNPDLHLIYGYMQVEYKISYNENRDKVKTWMSYHPHLNLKAWNNEKNAIYVGRKALSWNEEKSGAGVFRYHPSLVLTDTTPQNNPKKRRTRWRAELFPKDLEMTHRKPEDHITEYDEQGNIRKYFKAEGQGQEFIITDSSKIIDWVKSIIELQEIIL